MALALAIGTIGQEAQFLGKGRVSGVEVEVMVGVKTGEGVLVLVEGKVKLAVGTRTVGESVRAGVSG